MKDWYFKTDPSYHYAQIIIYAHGEHLFRPLNSPVHHPHSTSEGHRIATCKRPSFTCLHISTYWIAGDYNMSFQNQRASWTVWWSHCQTPPTPRRRATTRMKDVPTAALLRQQQASLSIDKRPIVHFGTKPPSTKTVTHVRNIVKDEQLDNNESAEDLSSNRSLSRKAMTQSRHAYTEQLCTIQIRKRLPNAGNADISSR